MSRSDRIKWLEHCVALAVWAEEAKEHYNYLANYDVFGQDKRAIPMDAIDAALATNVEASRQWEEAKRVEGY